jgi:hypothetical protein
MFIAKIMINCVFTDFFISFQIISILNSNIKKYIMKKIDALNKIRI